MATDSSLSFYVVNVMLILGLLGHCHGKSSPHYLLSRKDFPADFVFGSASSAYQYEGAAHEGGRGPSVWDTFTKEHPEGAIFVMAEKISDHSTGDVAVDFYHRYKEDIQNLKELNMDAFRFSISWSRVLPTGRIGGGVNKVGVKFYNDLINDLMANGQSKQKGEIGITLISLWLVPKNMTVAGVKAQRRGLDFVLGCGVDFSVEKDGVYLGSPTALSWLYVYPKGINNLMLYIKNYYKSPAIYITENGIGEANNSSLSVQEALKDKTRLLYHYQHLYYLSKAIKAGVDVRGYFAWSFLDDFEWDAGYTVRFGLNYVDYKNKHKRYRKYSALWFQKFLHEG
ncbi:Glycoside hydrolase family 1 [Dillenia turbinata]|uniref:Glycoside hydrolase family 1 n=1 Tax=Dillenia turbinata TaxID=194707 RepID=A0AAN8VQ81_9MAGN